MKRITLGLMSEMKAKVFNNEIIIDIPDSCTRDLWLAQLNVWLEENAKKTNSKVVDDGWLRIERNGKLSYTRRQ